MRYLIYSFILTMILSSCQKEVSSWKIHKTISLEEISPIGIVSKGENLILSDGDNNRLTEVDTTGEILNVFEDLERPMHIANSSDNIYIPEYGRDVITKISSRGRDTLSINEALDAPSGVDVWDESKVAIADFYNHRIVYTVDGTSWEALGKKGNADGEFHYPTDVQWTSDKLYVADTYNNRVQVFNHMGDHLLTFGQAEKMNATTGLFVDKDIVYVTDFENNRLLIYNSNGQLLQIVDKEFNKPTDVLLHKNKLYVTNYKGKSLTVLKQE